MAWLDRLIDEKIKAAQERGAFDRLAGAGKPLQLDDESGGEDWLANHILREAGALPEWLQLRKEIYEERPRVIAALREYQAYERSLDTSLPGHRAILARLEERYRKLAAELNAKIDLHNVRCPSIAHELPRQPEDYIARLRRRRTQP